MKSSQDWYAPAKERNAKTSPGVWPADARELETDRSGPGVGSLEGGGKPHPLVQESCRRDDEFGKLVIEKLQAFQVGPIEFVAQLIDYAGDVQVHDAEAGFSAESRAFRNPGLSSSVSWSSSESIRARVDLSNLEVVATTM